MTVYETDVPGVGRKFELETDGDERIIVIIHYDGKREVYRQASRDADSERLFSLPGQRARQLGSILEGAYFQPVETDDIQVPLGEAIIEWVEVEPDSRLVDETLRAANVRQRSGVSIIAVQRGEETVANPRPEFTIEVGDILVALGTRDEQAAFSRLVEAEAEGDEDEDGDGDASA